MMMPAREQMERLVEAHARLPERMDTAIWIKQDHHGEAWLVEVIPELSPDDRSGEPVSFNPGRDFPFPLHLIAGNREDIESAVRHDAQLASWIAEGEILHGQETGRAIQELASGLAHA